MMRFIALAAATLLLTVATHQAVAQTAASAPPPPMPVPESVVEQARDQNEGWFGTLARPRTSGQVQETWDESGPEDATYVTAMCDGCTYKVRVREYMVTVVELPSGEIIQEADLGDAKGFSVERRGDRRLAIRPVGHGYDTSLIVYGRSGRIYPFYLRAEGFNSANIPDLVVRIEGAVSIDAKLAVAGLAPSSAQPGTSFPAVAADRGEVRGVAEGEVKTTKKDFVEDATFTPDALRGWGDYRLWGDDSLRPETVFRDDQFTYVRFGDRWDDIELPTAYVVVDDIDELVNSRVEGTTFIIESTQPLITLKSGTSFLCIEYEGA